MGFIEAARRSLGLAKEPARVLFNGLDAAGKTTILYRMCRGEVVTTIPTIGFNVETLMWKAMEITAWDIGGRDKIRPLWRHYLQGTDGIVFVVDSSDHERVEDARQQLHDMLGEEEAKGVIVLIFAHKQDLPSAMTASELAEKLGLHSLRGKAWHIQPSSALTGDGLHEGLDWFVGALAQKRAGGEAGGKTGTEVQAAQSANCLARALALGTRLASPKLWLSLL
uniref:ADP-ribosylation factor n=1 Tax=Alexandrium catenella TaxID=2925 RepID=A0A7S1WPB7_ALECA|mmetsp:Transcript_79154/g.210196  ORF Transcript_79154/g.210196 Transcript_79154/m.210196 type:complete len:224 (+) Transcript_79154:82-753(+)